MHKGGIVNKVQNGGNSQQDQGRIYGGGGGRTPPPPPLRDSTPCRPKVLFKKSTFGRPTLKFF